MVAKNSVLVATFQEDGYLSNESHLMKLSDSEFLDYTICFWFAMNFERGPYNILLSIGTDVEPNHLVAGKINYPALENLEYDGALLYSNLNKTCLWLEC